MEKLVAHKTDTVRGTRRVVLALCAVTLAACAAPPASRSAAPGPGTVDPQTAAALFNTACVQALPDFGGTPQALAALPVTQSTRSGIYFHDQLDLSFKLTGTECSMVFGVAGNPNDAGVAFQGALNRFAPGVSARVRSNGQQGPRGQTYINARIPKS